MVQVETIHFPLELWARLAMEVAPARGRLAPRSGRVSRSSPLAGLVVLLDDLRLKRPRAFCRWLRLGRRLRRRLVLAAAHHRLILSKPSVSASPATPVKLMANKKATIVVSFALQSLTGRSWFKIAS